MNKPATETSSMIILQLFVSDLDVPNLTIACSNPFFAPTVSLLQHKPSFGDFDNVVFELDPI
jgi:hypothetical protein